MTHERAKEVEFFVLGIGKFDRARRCSFAAENFYLGHMNISNGRTRNLPPAHDSAFPGDFLYVNSLSRRAKVKEVGTQ